MRMRMLLFGSAVFCLATGCCLVRKAVTVPTGLVLKTGVKAGCGAVRCTGGAVATGTAELLDPKATAAEKERK